MPEPRESMEALEDRLSDAIENAMWAHEALKNDSICTCGVRNNMDGDVLTSHRVSEVVGAATAVLTALGLRQEDKWVPVDKDGFRWCARSRELAEAALAAYSVDMAGPAVDHIEHERRFVTPWVGVQT